MKGALADLQQDVAFWASLVKYLTNVGDAADGRHSPITSFYMWAWDSSADAPSTMQAWLLMTGRA